MSMTERLMGMLAPIVPLGAAALREVDMVQAVFRHANCYPAAIARLAAVKLDGVAEA
jgi:hypothetical protein